MFRRPPQRMCQSSCVTREMKLSAARKTVFAISKPRFHCKFGADVG